MTDAVLTVTELTDLIRRRLEETFPSVSVVGEISNFLRHGSGHMYFSLKDEGSQIRCALFRGNARRLLFDPDNGLKVTATGRISFYPPQGSCQLVVEAMMPLGIGELEIAFQRLKDRLEKEGLFAPELKKPLPVFPERIAVVTSPTGAAVRDVLTTLERRWPIAEVDLYPVRVQGVGSAQEIARALTAAGSREDLDVILLVRGGGSLEDLWSFNEEIVARALFACDVPVVSGVGHEIDFTIADFVADVRAPTPTGAAELSTPDREELARSIRLTMERTGRLLGTRVASLAQQIGLLMRSYGMRQPQLRVESASQRLDEVLLRAARGATRRLEQARSGFESVWAKLEGLSPRAAFERGYSLCLHPETGRTVRGVVESIDLGTMDVVFSDGRAHVDVKGGEEGTPWDTIRKA